MIIQWPSSQANGHLNVTAVNPLSDLTPMILYSNLCRGIEPPAFVFNLPRYGQGTSNQISM